MDGSTSTDEGKSSLGSQYSGLFGTIRLHGHSIFPFIKLIELRNRASAAVEIEPIGYVAGLIVDRMMPGRAGLVRTAQIGFALHPAEWGARRVSEALPEILNGLTAAGVEIVSAWTIQSNERSIRALRRAGFRYTRPGTPDEKAMIAPNSADTLLHFEYSPSDSRPRR